MTLETFQGLPVPNPTADGICPKTFIFDAVIEARARLLSYTFMSSLRMPLTWTAEKTAYEWCNAGRHGLTSDPRDLTYLTGAITEILAIDPVTREHLRVHGFAVPACGSCCGGKGNVS